MRLLDGIGKFEHRQLILKTLLRRLASVQERIRQAAAEYGRDAQQIRLLAVSKTRTLEDVLALASAGQQLFGENYLQEALQKINASSALAPSIEWHFIGPVQSNKTRSIAEHFAWVHSVDRLRIAQRLSEQRSPHLPPLNVCVQVNINDEDAKGGVAPAQAADLCKAVADLPHLCLRGLMAIPAPSDDIHIQRENFRSLRELRDAIMQQGLELDTLSMGMSNDLEAAIAEGATIVRIGTDIFGPRII